MLFKRKEEKVCVLSQKNPLTLKSRRVLKAFNLTQKTLKLTDLDCATIFGAFAIKETRSHLVNPLEDQLCICSYLCILCL